MGNVILILILMACSFTLNAQDKIVIGNSVTIKSDILNETRTILVYLPANYEHSSQKYPVIYLLDAETHFVPTAGLVQFWSRIGRMPESIIIGITNTNRNRDFTPKPTAQLPGSGGADNFLKFMNNELFPYVEKNYRIEPFRTVIGHSLCGLFSVYTLLTEPELFNAYIAISPWLIFDSEYMFTLSKETFSKTSSLKKFIYYTGGSAEEQDIVKALKEYSDLLTSTAPKDLRWSYKLMEGDDHNTLILTTIFDGLKILYDQWGVPDSITTKGIKEILRHYEMLSERLSYKVIPSEAGLNIAGYFFLQRNDFEEAIKIFDKNVELYPSSANVFDSRGEAYERMGRLKEAKENYEKASELGENNNDPNLNIFRNNLNRVSNLLQN